MSDGGRWTTVKSKEEKQREKKEQLRARKIRRQYEDEGIDAHEADHAYQEQIRQAQIDEANRQRKAEAQRKADKEKEEAQKKAQQEEKERRKKAAAETEARRQEAMLRQRKQVDPSMWDEATDVLAEKKKASEVIAELDKLLPGENGNRKKESRANVVERLMFVMGVLDTATHRTQAVLDPEENQPCEDFIEKCSEVMQAVDRHLTSTTIDTLGAEGALQLVAVHFGGRGVREVIFSRGSSIGASVVLQRVLAETAETIAHNIDLFLTLFNPQENLRQGTKSVVANLNFVLCPVLQNASDSALSNAVVRLLIQFTRATDAPSIAKAPADLVLCAGAFLNECASRFAETNAAGNTYSDETSMAKRVTMTEAAAELLWRIVRPEESNGSHNGNGSGKKASNSNSKSSASVTVTLQTVEALLTRVGALWNPASTRTLLISTLSHVINTSDGETSASSEKMSAAAEGVCIAMLSNGGESTFNFLVQQYGKHIVATNRVLRHFVQRKIPMPPDFVSAMKEKASGVYSKKGEKSAAETMKLLGKTVALKPGQSIVSRPAAPSSPGSNSNSSSSSKTGAAAKRSAATATQKGGSSSSNKPAKAGGRSPITLFAKVLLLLGCSMHLYCMGIATVKKLHPAVHKKHLEPHAAVLQKVDSVITMYDAKKNDVIAKARQHCPPVIVGRVEKAANVVIDAFYGEADRQLHYSRLLVVFMMFIGVLFFF